jgi:hypothetical protein
MLQIVKRALVAAVLLAAVTPAFAAGRGGSGHARGGSYHGYGHRDHDGYRHRDRDGYRHRDRDRDGYRYREGHRRRDRDRYHHGGRHYDQRFRGGWMNGFQKWWPYFMY